MPSLSERREDIELLAQQFIAEAAGSMDKALPTLSSAALELLVNYDFPGNVRELKTYLYDAVARTTHGIIEARMIAERLQLNPPEHKVSEGETGSLEALFGEIPTLDRLIDFAVDQALSATGNNQSQAAKLLGLSRQALNKRLKNRQRHS